MVLRHCSCFTVGIRTKDLKQLRTSSRRDHKVLKKALGTQVLSVKPLNSQTMGPHSEIVMPTTLRLNILLLGLIKELSQLRK